MIPITRPDDRIMSPNISPWARYADYLEWKVKDLIEKHAEDMRPPEVVTPPPIVVDHRKDLMEGTFNKLDLPVLNHNISLENQHGQE